MIVQPKHLVPPQDAKRCCQRRENLRRIEVRPPFVTDVCLVCGCRHFRLYADLGQALRR
jgi:hypothetical protein